METTRGETARPAPPPPAPTPAVALPPGATPTTTAPTPTLAPAPAPAPNPTSYPLPVFNAASLPRPPPPPPHHLPHLRPGRYSLQPPAPPLPSGTSGGIQLAPLQSFAPTAAAGGTVAHGAVLPQGAVLPHGTVLPHSTVLPHGAPHGGPHGGPLGGVHSAPAPHGTAHAGLPVGVTSTGRVTKPKATFDLSLISRAETKLEDETFEMSKDLQSCLLKPERTRDPDALVKRVCEEALQYAERRKEIVRESLKKQLRDTPNKLSNHDKGKLRSRREAKVHRVKEQQLELALKAAIRWLIAESSLKPEHHPAVERGVNELNRVNRVNRLHSVNMANMSTLNQDNDMHKKEACKSNP